MSDFAKFSVTKLTLMCPRDFDPDADIDHLFDALDLLAEKIGGAMQNEIAQMIEAGLLPEGAFVAVES